MNRTRLLWGVGALGVAGGGVAIWYAFQRRMCTAVGGVESQCGPNVAYLIPGIVAALVGIGLVLFALQRGRSGRSPPRG